MPLKILVAQINCVVGDVATNASKILSIVDQAKSESVDLVVTPELSLCGYPPDFLKECHLTLKRIANHISGITLIVGHPHREGQYLYNAASVIQDGQIVARYFKQELPNYRVFDEARYFKAGEQSVVFSVAGVSFGRPVWVRPTL